MSLITYKFENHYMWKNPSKNFPPRRAKITYTRYLWNYQFSITYGKNPYVTQTLYTDQNSYVFIRI